MSSSLKEIHAVQTELLLALREVCDRHNIPYFLAQGTLLGAVRHKGFIPWDDDVDVIMPASVIPEFARHFRAEMGDRYFVTDFRAEEKFPLTWTKIRKNGTVSMPKKYKDIPIHWGISIDVFPLYEVGDSALARHMAYLRFKFAKKMLAAYMTPYEENPSVVDRVIAMLPDKFRRRIAESCMHALEKQEKPGKHTFTICRNSHFLQRKWMYGEEKYLSFEGESYRVPSDSHAFLTEMFGDYMTPPPPEDRGGHELKLGEIIWDTEKDYSEYK